MEWSERVNKIVVLTADNPRSCPFSSLECHVWSICLACDTDDLHGPHAGWLSKHQRTIVAKFGQKDAKQFDTPWRHWHIAAARRRRLTSGRFSSLRNHNRGPRAGVRGRDDKNRPGQGKPRCHMASSVDSVSCDAGFKISDQISDLSRVSPAAAAAPMLLLLLLPLWFKANCRVNYLWGHD